MTIQVTERWEGKSHSRTDRGWEATRTFDVTGTSNGQQASLAPNIPVKGDPHPENTVLTLTRKRARQQGPQWFVVSCRYAIERVGGQREDEDENLSPLFEPAKIDVTYANEREEFDRTPRGFAILNSAHKPFDGNPSRDAGPIKLTIERNEPFYDADKALRFKNLINTDVVRLEGRILFGQLVGRILSIEPAGSFTFRDAFVPVRYQILLRGRLNVDGAPVSGHHVRLMDRGYYKRIEGNQAPLVLRIYDDAGDPVEDPVPLNGKGDELGSNLGLGPPPGVLATERTQDAVWFWYARYPEGSYRGLF